MRPLIARVTKVLFFLACTRACLLAGMRGLRASVSLVEGLKFQKSIPKIRHSRVFHPLCGGNVLYRAYRAHRTDEKRRDMECATSVTY
jgi:hypothetical protein